MIRKLIIVALLTAALFGMVTQAGAQTPTATPAPPKANATATPTVAPVVAPPKAAAPAPAKTGNAGLAADSSMVPVLVLGVFALALVAGARVATRKS